MLEKEQEKTRANQKNVQAKSNLTLHEIDIRPIKSLVKSKEYLFTNKAFCQTLLAEKDFMSSEEFLAKLETWLNLLKV